MPAVRLYERRPAVRALVLILGASVLSACGMLRRSMSEETETETTDAAFSELARYSDRAVMRVNVATREFADSAGTREAQIQAAAWRLNTLGLVTQTVGQPSAITGLLDMAVLMSVARWLQEDYWVGEVWGELALPVAKAFELSEQDAWDLLEVHLEPEQVSEARELLQDWREENPKLTPQTLIAFPSLLSLVEDRREQLVGSNLLDMVGMDPLAGLEPVARQVELSRVLGLRALYFAQRAGRLLGAEVDLRMLEARETPEMRQVLENVDTLSNSVASFAETAASLPDEFRTARQELLDQVSSELTAQREGLVSNLAEAREPLDTLLARSEATLDAATQASTSVTGTVEAIGRIFMRADEEPEEPPPEPSAPSKPFDVTEYGAAAESVGAAAERLAIVVQECDTLLRTLDQELPAVQRVLGEAAAHGRAGIDRLLVGVLLVGLVLIGAGAGAVLLVRRLAPR